MYYIAVIGDIKSSKKIKNRRQVQEKLNVVLKYVNEALRYKRFGNYRNQYNSCTDKFN